VLADDAALRVDEHQGWPGPARELMPDIEVTIIDHGMLDPVAQHGIPQVRGVSLGGELRRVDTDDDHPVAVLLLDFPQLRKQVHAIDSAEGPEVDDRQPPAQVRQPERPGHVQPIEAFRKLGRPNLPGERVGGHRLRLS